MRERNTIISSGEPELTRLNAFGTLADGERSELQDLAGDERRLDKGGLLWRETDGLAGLFLLTDGWMASLRSSGTAGRQMIKVHLPGDLLGLPSLAFRSAGEDMVALTAARVRPLRLHSFGTLFETQPRLSAMMFLVSQQERMDLTDRLVNMRRVDLSARIATVILQLSERIERAYPTQGLTSRLPLTTADLADLVGVTRTRMATGLKRLRERDLVGWSRQRLTIIDPAALANLADRPIREVTEDAYWMPSAR